ncbi:diacylglycerol kinase family lipid kinase [Acidaminobacter sp. JC074]|uniref:diacylglycerol/lipid kinase family protein n=1 Tax=Acidaminobacter sp. JC074 TaxID=2530199 RepID=UPI001F0EE6C8|nr:diacylglycerol kinase family protein [Acidaminobacter sp. JC074]MCH4891241.1 diacylglycerol kinase family lipid kinase [Acidaminobacter sp. JC074]
MRKIKFIINPAAGHGESKETLNLIHNRFQKEQIAYSISISGYEGHIEKIAKEAVQEGYTDVVAVGGDGTVLEAFNGIFNSETNLGIIPAGTGNDFVRMIDIGNNFEKALEKVIEGQVKKVDIGLVNDTHFLNVVAMGIDGDIVNLTEKVKKFLKGSTAYIYSTFSSLLKYKCKNVLINIDGLELKREVYLVAVGNGKYFGGGMMITPGAEIDSENFELVIINKMSKSKFAVLFRKVFSGNHVHEDVVEVLYGKKITIQSEEGLLINADGNIIGDSFANIQILPKAQNVII